MGFLPYQACEPDGPERQQKETGSGHPSALFHRGDAEILQLDLAGFRELEDCQVRVFDGVREVQDHFELMPIPGSGGVDDVSVLRPMVGAVVSFVGERESGAQPSSVVLANDVFPF